MRPTSVTLALLAATLSATASAQDLAADIRPPPFWPLQRADTLILRAGPDAGSPSSLAALDRFPCRGNACRPQVVEEGTVPAGELWEGSSGAGTRARGVERSRDLRRGGPRRVVVAVSNVGGAWAWLESSPPASRTSGCESSMS